VFPVVLLITGSGVAYAATRVVRRNRDKRALRNLLGEKGAQRELERKKSARSRHGFGNLAARLCGSLAPKREDLVAAETDVGSLEEWSTRYFAASSVAFPMAVLGIWSPVLRISSIVILTALTLPIVERCYTGLVERKRLKMELINLVALPLMIYSGYLPAAAFGYWAYYLGILFLARAKNQSAHDVTQIFDEIMHSVWIEKDGLEIEIAYKDLQINDVVIVHGGGIIPVDGIITKGMASIDQRMLTGEAQPAEKETGESVFAFTTVMAGKIWIKAEKTGQQTVALQINQVLEQTTAIIDNLNITGNLSVLTHLSTASREMLLIKDGRALERLRDVDTIVFDKTGTLTEEQPHVGKIHVCDDSYTESEILYYAAIAEHRQSHPIARAIIQESEARSLKLPSVDDAHYEIGYGIRVHVEDQVIRAGSGKFMKLENIRITDEMISLQTSAHDQGYSFVYIAVGQVIAGIIELHPTVRPEAKEIIGSLKQRGLTTYIISGDHEAPTMALASELGMDHYFAETGSDCAAAGPRQIGVLHR